MNSEIPIHRERGKVSFALYLYPFEATNIAPARGGENVEQVVVDGSGVEIARREYPSDWTLICEERLWWISLPRPWLQNLDIQIPSNATQLELEFLITALNVCVDTTIFFARFARRDYQGIVSDGEISRPSSFHEVAQVLERPIPQKIVIDGDKFTKLVSGVLDGALLEDGNSDLNKAIQSYRAAVQSFHSEVHARLLYSVCENILSTGYPSGHEKDEKISDISTLGEEEAEAWRHLVDRTKHPDEGTEHSWDDTFEDVPPPVEFRMREAANEALCRQILTD